MPEAASNFMQGMMAAPYFFPVLKATETLGGFLLLSGIAAPVGLLILTPITLHILLFHGLLTPGLENLILPLVMCVLHALSTLRFWAVYAPLFKKDGCCSKT